MFIKIENERILNASNWQLDETYKETDFNYENYIDKPQGYFIFDGQNIVKNSEFEEEEKQKERERLSKLSLTKREVFLAIYEDKGLTPEDIKEQLRSWAAEQPGKDINSALIEFDYANEYFRGNPLIDKIGLMLGYTSEDLDYLFQNKEFLKEKNDD